MSWSEWKALLADRIANVPESSGIYRLGTATEILYIGRTDNLRKRLMEHLNSDDPCIKKAKLFQYLVTTSPERTEDNLLKEYKNEHGKLPECNEKKD